MSLRFIYGRAGSGKSQYCLNSIKNRIEEDKMLFDTLRKGINKNVVELIELDFAINDVEFAEMAAQRLIDLMNR